MESQPPLFQQGGHLKQKNGIHKHHINNHHSRISNNSWDTHKKIKTMPLAPKQQPPYYVPEPMPTPPSAAGAIRIYANTTHEETVGTALKTFYTFDIPANTLTQTGESVKIKFIAGTGGSGSFNTKIYINTTLSNTISTLLAGGQQLESEIIRTGTTTAEVYYTTIIDTMAVQQVQQLTGLDFTAAIEIEFTGQSGDATVLTAWGVTMDKYKL